MASKVAGSADWRPPLRGEAFASLKIPIMGWNEHMTTKAIDLITKGSIAIIAALILNACGGGDSGDSNSVSVPNVVGDTQAAASAAISGAGLTVGTVTSQSSSTVASGEVVSESPAAATRVAKGSAVALVVSSGAATYTVGGTLIGLAAGATVQVLNGTETLPVAANGSFTLPTGLLSGGGYAVTVGTPTSAQTCTVQNGSGTVASANVTNVLVYCTYTVKTATLNATYTTVFVNFNDGPGDSVILDSAEVAAYNGAGGYSGIATFNYGGTILTNFKVSDTYAVATTNGIPKFSDDTGVRGGIEGANADSTVGANALTGIAPGMSVGVLPNASATTDSIDGDYTLVNITASLSTKAVSVYEATITVTTGVVAGTYVENSGGTITTGNPASGTWSVTNGAVTAVGSGSGAVSADGDLIVLADTHSGDNPYINVAVRRGSGVTEATFEGVYSLCEYGGTTVSATFGEDITLFAYGNGTYGINFTKNAQGTITTNNTNSGTYTMAADGTLTLTDSDGKVYNGAISADGNALALGSVTSGLSPAIFVGVRQ
jgi:hypothetical protein